MPELKRNFLKGRMNKDLDERLVPDGEYRDALNIEVSTTEDSDVGAIQTSKGNVNLSNIPELSLGGTFCVGSIADEKVDKIYWLIAGDDRDIIAEYDYNTGFTNPVLIDMWLENSNLQEPIPRVLNFDKDRLITGINIIDDMLFWTDNHTEPKQINITRCKAGSSDFATHTTFLTTHPFSNAVPPPLWQGGATINSRPIKEEHITVIKESPAMAPALEMKNTTHVGKVGGVLPSTSFWIWSGLLEEGSGITITLDAGDYDYTYNDVLKLTTTNSNAEELEIRVKIADVYDPDPNVGTSSATDFWVRILSIDTRVLAIDTFWEVELVEKAALFQFKFPRFATRYKYEDGEYSTFSPFTEVAFLPGDGEFDYLPKKGFNLSMVNDVRSLVVKDFVPEEDLLPDGVIEIDILYKESNSPSVYTVKTLTRDNEEWNSKRRFDSTSGSTLINSTSTTWSSYMLDIDPNTDPEDFEGGPDYKHVKGYMNITSELIHAVLPSNQLLRPWDNVPRKALAQEITGNRLVYGNYLQNYTVPHQSIEIGVWDQGLSNLMYAPEQIYPINAYNYYPAKSVKSLRTYQLGVVYIDEYGRETPVISNEDKNNASSIYLKKSYAEKQNKLTAKITTDPPDWAKSFKFFIKETSNEYYNLAVDRWYDAKDDNIWLSFPSSERNKVDIDTFLILKKEHDSGRFVAEEGRYKILAIENEAPIYIKETVKSFGVINDNTDKDRFADGGGTGFPLVGYTEMWVDKAPWEDQGWKETIKDKTNLYMRMADANSKSQWYAISSISLNTQSGSHYVIKLVEYFKDDIALTSTNNTYLGRNAGLSLEIMQRIVENKAEFDGRFFVKIHKDLTLLDRLVGQQDDNSYYVVRMARPMSYINNRSTWSQHGTYTAGSNKNTSWYGWTGANDRLKIEYKSGNGEGYWKEVKNSGGEIAGANRGRWFIDSQNAFAPMREGGSGSDAIDLHPIAAGTTPDQPANTVNPLGLRVLDTNAPPWDDWFVGTGYPFSYKGIDHRTWDGSAAVETGISDWYSPSSDHKTGFSGIGVTIGNKIQASTGIRRNTNRINVAFTAPGDGVDSGDVWGDVKHYTGSMSGGINPDNIFHSVNIEDWDYYTSEELFINTLTTHGTLWRFKEDPDQIVYRTESGTSNVPLFNYHNSESIQDITSGSPKYRAFKGSNVWTTSVVRRDRFTFRAKSLKNDSFPGVDGENKYLPTNPPHFVSSQDSTLNPNGYNYQIKEYKPDGKLTIVDLRTYDTALNATDPINYTNDPANISHPLYEINKPLLSNGNVNPNFVYGMDTTLNALNNPGGIAPGIRHDGMPNSSYAPGFSGNIEVGGSQDFVLADGSEVSSNHYPGHIMWEILEQKDEADLKYSSRNPAIFETEPKEDVGLDIYYEVGQEYPITLDDATNEQYIPIGSVVTKSGVTFVNPVRVNACNDSEVTLVDDSNNPITVGVSVGDTLWFTRADGSATSATVSSDFFSTNGVYGLETDIWKEEMRLPWFNCYSFGNGVESDRIRDDFNQVTIDNGPKASTTLDEPYMDERRGSGLIHSGIYNSTSGINNLNQFIQAEKITKDLNPIYGSIQKLHTRDTNLITLCEDKCLKVLANKDALFNADGNVNLTATENVLGQTTPFKGEFGISKNPESFASESYRAYFTDKTRGTVLRLSQDGLTPISDVGMKDWFSDNLQLADNLIGSYDDKKSTYNLTLTRDTRENSMTISFNEKAKGWTSFKSFIQESGLSMNNGYYTFAGGDLWEHHKNPIRNSFYGSPSGFYDSSVKFLFNDIPNSVKSFNTLNYEGSQAKITQDLNDPDYYNNREKLGWYVSWIETNLQTGNNLEFKNKEGKWFSTIKGETTTFQNLDTKEFSVQGIGNAGEVFCPECPTSWVCNEVIPGIDAIPGIPAILGTPAVLAVPGTPAVPAIPGTQAVPAGANVDTCRNVGITLQLDAPEMLSDAQLRSWLTNNVNRSIDFTDKKICLPMPASTSWALTSPFYPDPCPCTSPEVSSGFSVGGFVWSYNHGAISVTTSTSWDNFVTAIIATGAPEFLTAYVGMSYAILENQLQTYGHGVPFPHLSWLTCECTAGTPPILATPSTPGTPAVPGTPYIPAVTAVPAVPGIPAVPPVCECVEVPGSQGHPSKFACETASNCCGTTTLTQPVVESYNCTASGCVDPGDGSGQYSTWCDCIEQGGGTLGPTGSIPGPCCDTTVIAGTSGYNHTRYETDCLGYPSPPTIYGCTDPNALNYYAAAQVDICTCIYTI